MKKLIPVWGTQKNRDNAQKEVRALFDAAFTIIRKRVRADAVRVARKFR
jgi:hypothetical protein